MKPDKDAEISSKKVNIRLISRNFTPQRSQTEMSRKRRRPKCKGHLDHTFRAAEQDFGSLFWARRILIFH